MFNQLDKTGDAARLIVKSYSGDYKLSEEDSKAVESVLIGIFLGRKGLDAKVDDLYISIEHKTNIRKAIGIYPDGELPTYSRKLSEDKTYLQEVIGLVKEKIIPYATKKGLLEIVHINEVGRRCEEFKRREKTEIGLMQYDNPHRFFVSELLLSRMCIAEGGVKDLGELPPPDI